MKILRISLRNLASLAGTQTVDFTAGDLSKNNLFAISGPTGAGKSTLLDALCLALYEETPRLSSVKGAVKLTDKGDDTITQSDAANLLRRGTGEGFAEVAFVGVDNLTYTARWCVRRARNRPDGPLQNTEMAFFSGNVVAPANGTRVGGDLKKGIKAAIIEKLGLTYEQFTRAVLLAQNDFATFLKADDTERAGILQALTGTTRFEKISKAVFDRCKRMDSAVVTLENRLKGLSLLPPDERTTLDEAIAELNTKATELAGRHATRSEHARWHTRADEIATLLSGAETRLTEAGTRQAAASPRRESLAITEAARRELRPAAEAESRTTRTLAETQVRLQSTERDLVTAGADHTTAQGTHTRTQAEQARVVIEQAAAKTDLDHARALDAQLPPLDLTLAGAKADADKAGTGLKTADATVEKLRTERDRLVSETATLTKRLVPLAHFRPLLAEAAAWHDRLDRAAQARAAARDAEAERLASVRAHSEAEKLAATERDAETGLRAKADAARSAEEAATTALAKLDADGLPARREELTTAVAVLKELGHAITERDTRGADLADLEEALSLQRNEIKETQAALATLKTETLPTATRARDDARIASEAASAIAAVATRKLREELKPGCPCAVCGSQKHPYAETPGAADAIGEQVTALKKTLTHAEKRLEKCLADIAHAEAQLKSAGTALTKAEKELAAQKQKLADDTAKIDAFRQQPVAAPVLAKRPTDQAETCAKILAQTEADLKAVASAEKTLLKARKDAEDARKVAKDAGEAHAKTEKYLGVLAGEIKVSAHRVHAAETSAGKCALVAQTSLDALAPVFAALPDARSDFAADAETFAQKFKANTDALADGDTRLREIAADLTLTTNNLTHAEGSVTEAKRISSETQNRLSAAKTARDKVADTRAALFTGRSVAEVERGFTEAVAKATEAEKAAHAALALKQIALTTADTRHKETLVAVTEARAALGQATAELDTALARFASARGVAFDRAALTTALAHPEAFLQAEHADLRRLDDTVTGLTGEIRTHWDTQTAHAAAQPTTDGIETVRTDLAEIATELKTTTALRDEKTARRIADDSARAHSGTLATEIAAAKTAAEPWSKLNDLIGSADGAKFRDIAQRHTLDILLGYANAQLSLFAGRYRLERVPQSLNLQVVDTHMGDERRSVHSLSGGESFLVSLALALGLASLTSNRLRIESLFIDEGFGALDQDTLTTALNALMHLEAQGRKIGVISHVTEMADAIPVQITVRKHRGASYLHCPGTPDSPPTDTAIVASASAVEGASHPDMPVLATRIEALLRANPGKSFSAQLLKKELRLEDSPYFDAAREHLVSTGRALRPEGSRSLLAPV